MDSILGALLQNGVLGILTAILLILSRSLLKREADRADKLAAKNDEFQSIFFDKVIPTLENNVRLFQEVADILHKMEDRAKLEEAVKAELKSRRETTE